MGVILKDAKIFSEPVQPLGILYLAAVLLENNFNVIVRDYFSYSEDIQNGKDDIKKIKPDIVGISCLTSNAILVYEIGKWIKNGFPKITVVLGNHHASIFADFFLRQKCCDFVVHGEGEFVFLELVRCLEQKKDCNTIKGISFLYGDDFVRTPDAPKIKDIDDIPFPARHLLDPSIYHMKTNVNMIQMKNKNYAPMMTSRGCVHACTFCTITGKKYRTREPKYVVDELEHLVHDMGVEITTFDEPFFFAYKKRVIEICNLIKQRSVVIPWNCQGHVNYISEDLLHALKEAGCYQVGFGIETGVQSLLDRIKKRTTLEQIEKAVKMTKKAGVKVFGSFMLGLPGETPEMSRQTIEFACRLPLDVANFTLLVPFPGSELYFTLVANKEIVLSDDPQEMLQGWMRYTTYPCFSDFEPIWLPKGRNSKELRGFQKTAIRKFFLRPRFVFERIKMLNLQNIAPVTKLTLGLFRK